MITFRYTVKYGPTVNGLDCGHTLLVRVYGPSPLTAEQRRLAGTSC